MPPRTKLTEEQVENIYWRYQQGGNTYISLADEYGVDTGTISAILRGKTWAWLTGGKPAKKPPTPARTHCGRGHEMTEDNKVYRTKEREGCAYCKQCRNLKRRQRDKQKRGYK